MWVNDGERIIQRSITHIVLNPVDTDNDDLGRLLVGMKQLKTPDRHQKISLQGHCHLRILEQRRPQKMQQELQK